MKPSEHESESSYELCVRALLCIDESRDSLTEFKTKLSELREHLDRTERQRPPWEANPNRAAASNNRRRRQ